MSGPTLTEQLASWVLAFDPGTVAPPLRHRLKLSVLDSIGCAWRARASAITAPILAARAPWTDGGSHTIVGGTGTAPLTWAVLANAALIRALDFNDHQAIDPNDGTRLGGHPSDVLAVALGAGEAAGRSGREVLDSALMGYELFGRAQKVLGRQHSWDHVTAHGLTAPAIAGRLMGFTPDTLADALSLGAAHATTPGAVRRGSLSSAKFLAAPMVLHAGMTATLLAAAGATGPRAVFEDPEKGLLREVYTAGDASLLVEPIRGQPMVGGVTIKAYPGLDTAQALIAAVVGVRGAHGGNMTQPLIAAVVGARAAHGGPVTEIARVTLFLADHPMVSRQILEAGQPPRNRETADHSLAYLAAVALVEGGVSEAQYERELWNDPLVRWMMERIELRVDPRWEDEVRDAFPCRAQITTVTGQRHEHVTIHAPGHARNPMDLVGVVAKFRANVADLIPAARAEEIIDGVMGIDELESIRELTAALGA